MRIDTRLMNEAEAHLDGESKANTPEALRRRVNTVGKPGEPGQTVRCVVSVAMLTEGWDACNVTHILGLRRSARSSSASRWWAAACAA